MNDSSAPKQRHRFPIISVVDPPALFENFAAVRERERVIQLEVEALDLAALRMAPLINANAKTGFSLDLPVGQTCRPTRSCAEHCYATQPGTPARWPKSLRHRLRNLRYFKLAAVDEAVERLKQEFHRHRARITRNHPRAEFDYLRVNGRGSPFEEVIEVVNAFAVRNPDVTVWVVNRRSDLASKIAALSNVFLQLSLDATTPPKLEADSQRLVAMRARAYLSFLRTSPPDDTRGAAIVFNEKHTVGLPCDQRSDYPVDAGRRSLGNVRGVGGDACARCRKCVTEDVLTNQRRQSKTRGVDHDDLPCSVPAVTRNDLA